MIILKYLHLAIDLGASGGKVMAGNIQNDKLILSEVNRFSNSPVEINGISYWNILNLYDHIIESIHIAQKNDQKILSLGIDSWGVDFGLLNKNGYLINNPIHYRNMFKTNIMKKKRKQSLRSKKLTQVGKGSLFLLMVKKELKVILLNVVCLFQVMKLLV